MYLTQLSPIGILAGFDIIFTTIAVANGPLAFVEMIKSAIPIIVLLVSYIDCNHSSTTEISKLLIFSIVLLTIGQVLIYTKELDFTWICFLSSIAALFSSGIKLHVLEKVLQYQTSANISSSYIPVHYNNDGMLEITDSPLNMEIEMRRIKKRMKGKQEKIENIEESVSLSDSEFNISMNEINVENKAQELHSILALFYFMPIAWFIAIIGFMVNSYFFYIYLLLFFR